MWNHCCRVSIDYSRGTTVRTLCLSVVGLLLCAVLGVDPAQAQDAAALRVRYAALRDQLAANTFGRPLYLESTQIANDLKGDIYAALDYPYGAAMVPLQRAHDWCGILILHLNVKNCWASQVGDTDVLAMSVGRKYDQPLSEAYEVRFVYQVDAASADYLGVRLSAAEGPLGTKEYQIKLEAVPLDAGRTFVHLSYSYTYGWVGRIAMQLYFSTIGHDKVGFSAVRRDAAGQPVYIGGMRGVMERNAMRYHLAVEAYLGALKLPATERMEKSLQDWYDATERYPLQLHELERNDYLEMKRSELKRQEAGR